MSAGVVETSKQYLKETFLGPRQTSGVIKMHANTFLLLVVVILQMCSVVLSEGEATNENKVKVPGTKSESSPSQSESETPKQGPVTIEDEIMAEETWEGMQEKARAAGKEVKIIEIPNYMVPLNKDTLEARVLESQECWIVVVHNGTIPHTWLTMVWALEGIVWIGGSDVTEDDNIAKSIGVPLSEVPTFAVFPHGFKKGKKQRTITQDIDEARKKAVSSIPSRFHKFRKDEFQSTLMHLFMLSPSKFPAFLITDEPDVPLLFKALSVRFERYFDFQLMHNPTKQELKTIGMSKVERSLPAFMVMVVEGYASGKPDITLVFFEEEKNGDMNYANLMRFLFIINNKYRAQIPGNHMADKEEILKMEDISDIEQERFEMLNEPTKSKATLKNEL